MTLPIDFAAIIDIVTSFIITLIVTFVAYKLLAQDTSFDENKEKRLALRLNTISKSQDMLLESAAGDNNESMSLQVSTQCEIESLLQCEKRALTICRSTHLLFYVLSVARQCRLLLFILNS